MTQTMLSQAEPRGRKFLVHPYAILMGRLLGAMKVGRLSVRLPNGEWLESSAANGPEALLDVRRWRALRRLFLHGDVGFAESYVDGDWTSPDLTAVLRVAAANMAHIESATAGRFAFRLINRIKHWRRGNSRSGSRRNIMSHYDLGNDFFGLWLDPSMFYSSGLYDAATPDLESAQAEKLSRIIELLGVTGGENVLEIGCGWGALAEGLARQGAAGVVGLTLSPSQLGFARERIAAAGLDDRVELRLQDYRDVSGAFDRIVSIEMIEAVGEAFWPSYFATIARSLKSGGRALIQAITIEDDRFDSYRKRPDFIQRHIFPGGFLPCDEALAEQVERAGLRLAAVEHFGLSYAQTLADWRNRFEARWREISTLGFDERFRRLWTYYLCYCEAGFLEKATNVGFYVIEKPRVSP
jgi:cyclopropane-fatty-acyl-phospholipid synthase